MKLNRVTIWKDDNGITANTLNNEFQNVVNTINRADPNSSYVNVKDFGAQGDSTTDDTLAIQSAINSSAEIIYFPPGTYIVSSALTIKSNCLLLGADKYLSTLSLPQSNINPMNFCLITNSSSLSNFSVRHLGFLGNRSFQTTSFSNGSNTGMAIGFFTGTMSNITFDNLYVREFGATGGAKNSGGGAIIIANLGTDSTCTDISCVNTIFGNNDKLSGFYMDCQNGSSTGGAKNITVSGNTFHGGGNNNAVYVLGGYGASSSKKAQNVAIDDNLFYITENLDSCIEVNGTHTFSISKNHFVFTSTGVGQTALVRSDCMSGVVDGNVVETYNSDTSKPTLTLVAFNTGEHQDSVVVSNNSFYSDNVASTDLLKVLKGSRRVTVRDNTFFGNSTTINRAMSVGECSDVEIVGNKFQNCGICIVLSAGSDPSTTRMGIRSNRFYDCGGSGVTNISTTGGAIDLTYVEVEDNVIVSPKSTSGGATFAALSVNANTGNVLLNNKVYGGLALTDATTEWAYIEGNLGYNPVGISTITVTASPFTYTAGKTHETVYIYGGTVSDVSVGSSTIATASPTQVQLDYGQAVVVTYTVAPTMKKYIH